MTTFFDNTRFDTRDKNKIIVDKLLEEKNIDSCHKYNSNGNFDKKSPEPDFWKGLVVTLKVI